MICPTDPPKKKKNQKIPKNFQAKAIQGHVPWLRLKKNFQINFSQYAVKQWNPLVQIHAPISWGCPKMACHSDPISLLISTFGIHLQPRCKSHGQIIHYNTAKNVQKQVTVFIYL